MVRPGLGASTTAVVDTAVSTAATTAGLLSIPAVGLLPAIAGPIGAAVAGVVGILSLLGVGQGCGQSCIVATNAVNAIEQAMRQNLAAFQAGQLSREQALANFDALWAQRTQACMQIGGQGGQGCLDHAPAAGTCYIKNPDGSCFNWYLAYRTPIEQAAPVVSTVLPPAVSAAAGRIPFLGWLVLALGGVAVAEAL